MTTPLLKILRIVSLSAEKCLSMTTATHCSISKLVTEWSEGLRPKVEIVINQSTECLARLTSWILKSWAWPARHNFHSKCCFSTAFFILRYLHFDTDWVYQWTTVQPSLWNGKISTATLQSNMAYIRSIHPKYVLGYMNSTKRLVQRGMHNRPVRGQGAELRLRDSPTLS